MKKTVTVKKCRSHRYAVRFFAALLAAFPLFLAVFTQQLLSLPGAGGSRHRSKA